MNLDSNIHNRWLASQIQWHIRRITCHSQVGFILGMQAQFNIHKSTNIIYHINKTKDKNHRIILRELILRQVD